MSGLKPAGLGRIALQVVLCYKIKQIVGAVAHQMNKRLSQIAIAFDHPVWFHGRKGRDNLPVIAPRSTPTQCAALDKGHRAA